MIRQHRTFSILLLLILFSLCSLSGHSEEKELSLEERIDIAIDKGAAYLTKRFDLQYAERMRLHLYAVTHADPKTYSTVLDDKYTSFASDTPSKTYDRSLLAMGMALQDGKKYLSALKDIEQFLWNTMDASGGWAYGGNNDTEVNNSTTQFAVLALLACRRASLKRKSGDGELTKIERKRWKLVAKYWLDQQERDGGWNYQKKDQAPSDRNSNTRFQSYFNMTCAGISSLAIARLFTADDKELERQIDTSISRGKQWLDQWVKKHGIVIINGHLTIADTFNKSSLPAKQIEGYALLSLEKAADLANITALHGKNWYRENAKYLLDIQHEDGSWEDGAKGAYAILFLRRASLSIFTGDRQGDWAGPLKEFATKRMDSDMILSLFGPYVLSGMQPTKWMKIIRSDIGQQPIDINTGPNGENIFNTIDISMHSDMPIQRLIHIVKYLDKANIDLGLHKEYKPSYTPRFRGSAMKMLRETGMMAIPFITRELLSYQERSIPQLPSSEKDKPPSETTEAPPNPEDHAIRTLIEQYKDLIHSSPGPVHEGYQDDLRKIIVASGTSAIPHILAGLHPVDAKKLMASQKFIAQNEEILQKEYRKTLAGLADVRRKLEKNKKSPGLRRAEETWLQKQYSIYRAAERLASIELILARKDIKDYSDEDANILKSHMAEILAEFKIQGVLPLIEQLNQSPDPFDQDVINLALQNISKKKFTTVAEWTTWWESRSNTK